MHVGVISDSLYLWQQLFVSPHLPLLPIGYLCALVTAEISYWAIERPSMRLRGRLEEVVCGPRGGARGLQNIPAV